MSARESGSDTWPRLAEFPGDNLELGNAPEEDDVDHRGEPPSWVPGTTAVGTGAGPPDLDETDDGQLDNGPMYAAGPEDSDAPGPGDAGAPEYQSGAPDYQPGGAEFQNGAPEYHSVPDGTGYGDAPAQAPDFGEGVHEAPDFAAPPMAFGEAHQAGTPEFQDGPAAGAIQGDGTGYGDGGYTAGPAAGPGFDEAPAFTGGTDGPPFQAGTPEFQGAHSGFAPQGQQSFDAPGEPAHQGFTEGHQDNDYDGPFTGQFRGDYIAGAAAGYGAATQDDGSLRTAPGMGDGYSYRTGENGSQAPGQGYTSHYPPVEPPRASASSRISGMTASLRTRRPRAGKGKGKKRDQSGRQAQLTVSRVEPWSVMKFSFVISLVAFIVLFVAVAVLYAVLSGLGVFSALQHTVSNITSSQSSGGFNLMTYISASRVLGYTGLLGAINVVLITALSTVGAVLYNITSDLAGGIEITLKESD